MRVWQILAATLTAASHDWKACELSLTSVLGCRKQCGVNRNRKRSIFAIILSPNCKLPKRSNLNHFVLSSVAIKSCWQHDKLLSSLHMDGGWAALKIAKQNTCHEQQKPVPILFYLPCLKAVPALDDIQEVRTTTSLFEFFCLPQRPLNLCVHKRNVPARGLLWCGVVCGGPGRARETAPPVKLLFAATSPDPHTTGLYQNSRCTLRWGVPSFQFGLFMWDIMIQIHTHADGADY